MAALFDKLVKGALFGCEQCGQCLLSQTGLTCPMTCPKGLRNGPCGGTLDGLCEVLPDQPCVWTRIRSSGSEVRSWSRPLNRSLVNHSSLINFLLGADRASRQPVPFDVARRDAVTSNNDWLFQSNKLILTLEAPSPRTRDDIPAFRSSLEGLSGLLDAVNTTTNAGGRPSMHSLESAAIVRDAGQEPIIQFCGRDHDIEDFRRLLDGALADGHRNFLFLTGDWKRTVPRTRDSRYWFPMDSIQMVADASERYAVGEGPQIGVASNAGSTPLGVSVARTLAKVRAGAHFTQTQLVTDTEGFERWLSALRNRLDDSNRFKVLASIPLIGQRRSYDALKKLPGVRLSGVVEQYLECAASLAIGGEMVARRLVKDLLAMDVDGIHLMNFGMANDQISSLARDIRALSRAGARDPDLTKTAVQYG